MVNNNGADVTMTKHMTLISCTIHIDLSDTIIYVETYMLDEADVIAVRAPRAPPLPLDVLVVSSAMVALRFSFLFLCVKLANWLRY